MPITRQHVEEALRQLGGEAQIGDILARVLEIAPEDIEPPPEFGACIRTDFIKGMGKIEGKFVIVLDLNRVLSVDEVAVVAAMSRSDAALAD